MSAYQNQTINKKPLHGMFTAIPRHYDVINRVITLGMDKGWRLAAAKECVSARPQKILDLCCGTGDLSITMAGMLDYPAEIKGLDYSQPMLDIAAAKAAELKYKNISFVQGDASKLPFADNYFDLVGISFAFRNLTYKNPLAKNHLAEIVRVIKPGGRCVIVESSQPANGLVRALDHFYFKTWVYATGALISGNKPAYRYLADSATQYYSPAELKELLINSGFKKTAYRPLLLGAAGIHTAVK
jgi:demethylmenaquinone methyltransferase/2-methoxy-6-polyprenyl-1,4-benzoquinol methylase